MSLMLSPQEVKHAAAGLRCLIAHLSDIPDAPDVPLDADVAALQVCQRLLERFEQVDDEATRNGADSVTAEPLPEEYRIRRPKLKDGL